MDNSSPAVVEDIRYRIVSLSLCEVLYYGQLIVIYGKFLNGKYNKDNARHYVAETFRCSFVESNYIITFFCIYGKISGLLIYFFSKTRLCVINADNNVFEG